jgi:hypothetical protein
MTHLYGYRLGLALYFAAIVKGALGVSIDTYLSIQYYVMILNTNKQRRKDLHVVLQPPYNGLYTT